MAILAGIYVVERFTTASDINTNQQVPETNMRKVVGTMIAPLRTTARHVNGGSTNEKENLPQLCAIPVAIKAANIILITQEHCETMRPIRPK